MRAPRLRRLIGAEVGYDLLGPRIPADLAAEGLPALGADEVVDLQGLSGLQALDLRRRKGAPAPRGRPVRDLELEPDELLALELSDAQSAGGRVGPTGLRCRLEGDRLTVQQLGDFLVSELVTREDLLEGNLLRTPGRGLPHALGPGNEDLLLEPELAAHRFGVLAHRLDVLAHPVRDDRQALFGRGLTLGNSAHVGVNLLGQAQIADPSVRQQVPAHLPDLGQGELAALLQQQRVLRCRAGDLGISRGARGTGAHVALLQLLHQPLHARVLGALVRALEDERLRVATQPLAVLVRITITIVVTGGRIEDELPAQRGRYIGDADEIRPLLDMSLLLVVFVVFGDHGQVVLGQRLVDQPAGLTVSLLDGIQ